MGTSTLTVDFQLDDVADDVRHVQTTRPVLGVVHCRHPDLENVRLGVPPAQVGALSAPRLVVVATVTAVGAGCVLLVHSRNGRVSPPELDLVVHVVEVVHRAGEDELPRAKSEVRRGR